MSRYTVQWTDAAEQELAAIWMSATDRRAVSAADAAIARLLAGDPLRHGTDVAEGLRKLVVPPLAVFYSVDPASRLVEVSWVALAP